jgi:hypothetical protein
LIARVGRESNIEEVYLRPQRRLDRIRSVEKLSKKVQFELLASSLTARIAQGNTIFLASNIAVQEGLGQLT